MIATPFELITEAQEKQRLIMAQIRFDISSFAREREYHQRRLKTLTLAIDAMENELSRMELDMNTFQHV